MKLKTIFRVHHNRRNAKTSKDGAFPVEIEAYIPKTSERKFYRTGIRVKPEHWDERNKQVHYKHPEYEVHNKTLERLLNHFKSIEDKYRINKVPFHLKYLNTELEEEEKEESFLRFWDRHIKESKSFTTATRKANRTAWNHLKNFREEVLFTDVTPQFLMDFEDHLLEYRFQKGDKIHSLKSGFIHAIFKDLKAAFNKAIQRGIVHQSFYPFKRKGDTESHLFDFKKYKKYDTNIKYLTPEEITTLENLHFDKENSYLIRIRDMFLLSVYTGLRYSDISRLSKKHLVEKEGGLAIEIEQEKTENRVYIPVYKMFDKKPEMIIRTYLTLGRKALFGDLTNQYVNRELKVIAQLVGINKNLTFHMGRHSCATFLLSKGLPIEFVKEILGQKDVKTTKIYAKVMRTALEDALDNIKY